MREKLPKILDEEFYEMIPNKTVANNHRVLICFSEIPEAGKEKLAEKIVDRYKAAKITKDDARTLVYKNEKIENTDQVEEILDAYMETLMEKISKLPNGVVVLVSSVDRRFDKVQKWAEKYKYEIFLIKVETPKEEIIASWKAGKDKETFEWFVAQMDRWTQDFNNFSQKVHPDFIWQNRDEDQMEDLYSKLDQILL